MKASYESFIYENIIYESIVYESINYESIIYESIIYESFIYESFIQMVDEIVMLYLISLLLSHNNICIRLLFTVDNEARTCPCTCFRNYSASRFLYLTN